MTSVQKESARNLHRVRAGYQLVADSEIGSADEIYELFGSWETGVETGELFGYLGFGLERTYGGLATSCWAHDTD